MTQGSQKGRTLYDLLFLIVQKFGLLRLVLTIISIFVVGWLVAHFSAKCGTRVLVWGLFDYEKWSCDPISDGPSRTKVSQPSDQKPNEEAEPELPSTQVLVRWDNGNNCFFLGEQVSTSGNENNVIFSGFDDVREIGSERIVPILKKGQRQDLKINDNIYIEFDENRPAWVPATILKIEGNQIHAKLETAVAKTCGIDRQSISVSVDKVIVAAPR